MLLKPNDLILLDCFGVRCFRLGSGAEDLMLELWVVLQVSMKVFQQHLRTVVKVVAVRGFGRISDNCVNYNSLGRY